MDVTVRRQEVYELSDAFIIDIHDLDYVTVITPSEGYTESKARKNAPFTMHTPIGSSLDRGPQWRRPMDMETLNNYRELIVSLKGVESVSQERTKQYRNTLC